MKTILVARDNALSRLRLTTLLCGAGYRVIAVSNGRDALGAMLLHAPDLVILGLRLHEMDGADVVYAMRADPTLRAVPAIAIGVLPRPRKRECAIAAGFDSYLLESSPKNKLLAEVKRWIEPYDSALESPSGHRIPGGH